MSTLYSHRRRVDEPDGESASALEQPAADMNENFPTISLFQAEEREAEESTDPQEAPDAGEPAGAAEAEVAEAEVAEAEVAEAEPAEAAEAGATADNLGDCSDPVSRWAKVTRPTLLIGGPGMGGTLAVKFGLASLAAVSPWFIAFGALACSGRGLAHIRQGKLLHCGPFVAALTIANFLLSAGWALTADFARHHPDSFLVTVYLGCACAALWLVAALQGIIVDRRGVEETVAGKPPYPHIALGTAWVAAINIFRSGVTVADLGKHAGPFGVLVQVKKGQIISPLVTVLLFTGWFFTAHGLSHAMLASAPPPAAESQRSQTSTPSPSSAISPARSASSNPPPTRSPRGSGTSAGQSPTITQDGTTDDEQYDDLCYQR